MTSEVRAEPTPKAISADQTAAIVLTTLGFAFVADGLRDALDPRLRGER